MGPSRGATRLLGTVVVALVANLVLDVAFDLPMLVRWGLALAAVLAVVAVLRAGGRRADVQRHEEGPA